MEQIRTLMECLSVIPDPRVLRSRRHELVDIIVITICAVLCGADDFVAVADFGRLREEWFRERLELPNGIPSPYTFQRLFARLDPDVLQQCLREWLCEVRRVLGITAAPTPQQGKRPVVALDGKSLRRSFQNKDEDGSTQGMLHLVSAWATETGLSLGTVKVDSKSNEITALPTLLKMLDLKGCIVTSDAMGTQREIARQIVEQKGDYILSLKGNQQGLLERTRLFMEDALGHRRWHESGRSYETLEKDHGRIERRWYYLVDEQTLGEDLNWLDPEGKWEGLKSIGIVDSERTVGEKTSRERRYYISSLCGEVTEFARAVRAHWEIENSLHWVLDIAFREDDCRLRKDHTAENFALIRRFALSLLRQDKTKKMGVKNRRLSCGWDVNYLAHILSLEPPEPPVTQRLT